ncbi:ATP-binding protein [Nostoc sp. CHAB 5715]|uniref:ATP/GTP-binding protein n=1 Tax=Nostoc sp. CHAB 5715 TaxID=2780400 RepID=UPI001E58F712|nr:ATP-binding protein [Nostoc sp. CHAB 5715]MCC5625996.1 ATP-binding protein [Nostoc sp. CHAB 5715]
MLHLELHTLGAALMALEKSRQKHFKVAISGSHSTGKTTLFAKISSTLASACIVHAVPELARELILKSGIPGFLHPDNHRPSRLALMLAAQIQREVAHSRSHCVVCDRGILDNLAYASLLFSDYLSTFEGHCCQDVVESWLPTYDLILTTAIRAPMQVDENRVDDEYFRRNIELRMTELLNFYRVPTTALETFGDDEGLENSLRAIRQRVENIGACVL